jgi:hypothetical protein
MHLYYQGKVKYTVEGENGPKKVSESCIVSAVSVSDAEAQMIEFYTDHVGASDVVVQGAGEASISTVVSIKERDNRITKQEAKE